MHHRGRADFALLPNESGRMDVLAYDDDGSGRFNRRYRLSEYANEDVPHLIILLDSIPYEPFLNACKAGRFAWMDAPQKVIPPFPSLTEPIFSVMLGAPPLPGVIDQYYDPDAGRRQNNLWERVVHNQREPWERRLHYDASMFESGLAYIDPRPWLGAELFRAKQAFDESPDRVTLVYFMSASAMLSRYGREGLEEVIDGIERLCLRVLYDRRGAVKITLTADHGHNLTASKNTSLAGPLAAAGFHVTDSIRTPRDVVLEINGLVTCAGIRTQAPAAVAKVVADMPQVELAAYMDGERVIVRNARGSAAIDSRHHRLRYRPIDADVLGYAPVLRELSSKGKTDSEGFISDQDWFDATLDHEYPDGPRRLWDGLHGLVVHPPEVMIAVRDGYCAGLPEYEKFIHMASTHGGLNQINSATFLMSMTGRVKHPLRTRDVLATVEPGFSPVVRDR